jgi:hypothetical protein
MNSLKCLLVAFVLLCTCSGVKAEILYFEDFESFAAGTVLHNISNWEGWYGDAAAAAMVSNKYAFSGTKSVEVDSNSDAVHKFDVTEGKWVLTVMQYIPSGTSGTTRFHMQNTYGASIGRSVQWSFALNTGVIGDDYDKNASAKIIYDKWIELKLVIDLDNDHLDQYYNGVLFSSRPWVNSGTSQLQTIDLYGNGASSVYYDDIKVQDYLSSLVRAHNPSPETDAVDVVKDVALTWVAGRDAVTHDVYFGTNAEDVAAADRSNPLNVLVSRDQSETSFDPEGVLDYAQTYYWRIDEVNAATDSIVTGQVWTFTVEPFAYPITSITATASTSMPNMGPENTINGSGLDDLDQHSTEGTQMWMSGTATPHWIRYEFDKAYKLYELWVWNTNQMVEPFVGFGARSVTIEYSADGQDWTTLDNVPEFARAPGSPVCTADTTVDFAGAVAKYVKLTINSNWGGAAPQTGLSEVRFFYIPTQAYQPDPADDAVDVSVEPQLNWRPGRDAASRTLYIGTDQAAVAEGTASSKTLAEHGYAPANLTFATEYFWKVDEVDAAGVNAGAVWSFTTESFAPIDDFEVYNDDDNRIYQAWEDGVTNKASGSQVGYDESPFAERSVVHDGSQAMPLMYNNASSPYYSEAERTFNSPRDWTAHGADSLRLYFHGVAGDTPNSSERLYLTVKDSSGKSKTVASADAATVATSWQQWTIPLSEFTAAGVKMTAIKSIIVGVGNRTSPTAGGTGTVYIDDISYGRATQ